MYAIYFCKSVSRVIRTSLCILECNVCSSTTATIKPLVDGETYQFRVRGANAAGLGEPSKPTDKIVVEDQPAKPE